MRLGKCVLLTVGIILAVLTQVNAADIPSREIQELFSKSGLEKEIRQLPETIKEGFDQAAKENEQLEQLPDYLIVEMSTLLTTAFAFDKMKKTVIKELETKMSAAEVQANLKWLDSPLGKKCTKLEEAASTPEAIKEIEAYKTQIQKAPPSSARLKLIKELDVTGKITATTVEIAIDTQVAVTSAIMASLPAEQRKTPAQIRNEMEEVRGQIESITKVDVLVELLYTYRSITDRELQRYIRFTASKAGTRFNDAVIAGLKRAMLEGSITWSNSVVELLNRGSGSMMI